MWRNGHHVSSTQGEIPPTRRSDHIWWAKDRISVDAEVAGLLRLTMEVSMMVAH